MPVDAGAQEKRARLDQYGEPLADGAVARLGTVRPRHGGGGVRALAFDPDSVLLASAGDDYMVRLWDARTGQAVQSFGPHHFSIDSLAYAPDGKMLASGSNGIVYLWDVRTGKQLRELAVPGQKYYVTSHIWSVAFAPDGKTLAVGSADGFVRLWDPHTGKLTRGWKVGKSWVQHVAFAPNGKLLASCERNGPVCFWDLATFKEVGKFDRDGQFLVFSPDSKLVATCDSVHEVATGKQLESFYQMPLTLAFTADNRLRYSVNYGGLWQRAKDEDWSFRNDIFPKEHYNSRVQCAAVSPDRKLLASGDGDGRISIWDLAKDEHRIKRPGHKDPVTAVAFSSDGKQVVSASADGTVRLWDAASGKELRRLFAPEPAYPLHALAYSQDGKRVAFVDRWTLHMLDTTGGRVRWKADVTADIQVKNLAFAADGKHLIGHGPRFLWRWEVATGKVVNQIAWQENTGECSTHSTDGKLAAFATGRSGSYARVLHLDTGKAQDCIHSKSEGSGGYFNILSLAFSPDRKLLAAGSRDGCAVMNVASGKEVWSAKDLKGPATVAISPDGKLLACGSHDVRVWEAATGNAVATFRGHLPHLPTRALAFSPDSRRLATANDDTTIIIWQVGQR
jgi:WD40 repeat protein